jgi:hypothetical protein
MSAQIIYSIAAEGMTPAQVAEQFCRNYWDAPRRMGKTWKRDGDLCFQAADGLRSYRVVYDPGERLVRAATYRVEVVEP